MNNNLSDSNFPENTDENALYEQYIKDISTGNIDFHCFIDRILNTPPLKTNKASSNSTESIAEKVKEATISQDRIESTKLKEGETDDTDGIQRGSSKKGNEVDRGQILDKDINLDRSSSLDPVEDLVREWESNNKKLARKFRKIGFQAATVHITQGRGITVSDLVDSGFGLDNAQKLLPQAVDIGLLVKLKYKVGKQHQYVLSNYVHIINSKNANEEKGEDYNEIFPSDVSLILARELSEMNYVYHNIQLVTIFNHKEDYNALNWPIPSLENKQKVKSFTLEPKRSVNFRIAPTGTVNISIECTYRPFEFHTTAGLMNFFGTCGQIYTYLQLSTKNRVNIVPWFGDWSLQQFDYNKDLPTKDLKDKYNSKVINWSSKGVLKVYYLGVIFRIYCKMMPYIGESLRTEGRFSTIDKGRITDSLPHIAAAVSSDTTGGPSNNVDNIDGKSEIKHPFTTIEEMLLNRKTENNDMISNYKSPEYIRG